MRRLHLIGYPVAHSLSPVMQNTAIQALGLDYQYSLMSIPPGELSSRITELRDTLIAGFNVTIPHKIAVIPLLDALDTTALAVGAVNTVVNTGERLIGYNTDSTASVRALRESYGDLNGCHAVIVGAGGASRAVANGLAPYARSIKILTREAPKADLLASQIRGRATVRGDSIGKAVEAIHSADILVNATPVGMMPNIDASPIPAEALHPDLLVFDLVYNPERTRLITEAETVGARTLGGLSMLVYQGAEAFHLWTGQKASETLMMDVARRSIGGRGA